MYRLQDEGFYEELINIPTPKEIEHVQDSELVTKIATDIQQRYFPTQQDFDDVELQESYSITSLFTDKHLSSFLGIFSSMYSMGIASVVNTVNLISGTEIADVSQQAHLAGVIGLFGLSEIGAQLYKGSKQTSEEPLYKLSSQENGLE